MKQGLKSLSEYWTVGLSEFRNFGLSDCRTILPTRLWFSSCICCAVNFLALYIFGILLFTRLKFSLSLSPVVARFLF